MPWLFTRYQAAASEVPRLNDDNAASAATRDEEHAVSHLKCASRHRPADRFLEGLKMRSPVVNGFLIPNKRKQYKQKETNQHIQSHFSYTHPINKTHVKPKNKQKASAAFLFRQKDLSHQLDPRHVRLGPLVPKMYEVRLELMEAAIPVPRLITGELVTWNWKGFGS